MKQLDTKGVDNETAAIATDKFINMKIVHSCWSCNKEHELPEESPNNDENGIKCECGGYIVTPSGKVQVNVKPIVQVYQLNDCDGIAAESLEQAIEFYFSEITDYEEDLIDNPRVLSMDYKIFDDETRTTQISIRELIESDWKGKPFYAFSTEG